MPENKENTYDDIMYLEHPTSLHHPRMPRENRAAQFAPFAALTGHADAVEETARITQERIELTDERKEQINQVLQTLMVQDKVIAVYFLPDMMKEGGSYQTVSGFVDKIAENELWISDTKIPVQDLFSLELDSSV